MPRRIRPERQLLQRPRRLPPDGRPRSTDPDCPVYNMFYDPVPLEWIAPESENQLQFSPEPDWRNDPTYNLRRKPPRNA